jgi:phosphoribosylformylglycinamidine synthase
MSNVTQIRVEGNPGFENPEGNHVAHRLGVEPNTVTVVDEYYLEGVTPEQAAQIMDLLADSVTQTASAEPRADWDNPRAIEVAPLPGVMDPGVDPIVKVLGILNIWPTAVQTATEHRFGPEVANETLERARDTLANNSVQQIRTEPPRTLEVHGTTMPVEHFDLASYDDTQLMALSSGRKLALNLAEMQALKAKSEAEGRPLTDVELEAIAGAHWSEHCSHKTFAAEIIDPEGNVKPGFFDRIKTMSRPYFGERGVLSAFGDNSGVWAFYDGTALCIKLETHNSPMNLEPYGGAATGSGGVFRDIVGTGRGATVINSMHMQFLAPTDTPADQIPDGCHEPSYLLRRSVDGVRDYGNRMGIPTNDVSFHTDIRFRGKGAILVGALGIMPEANAAKGVPEAGDYVVAVGGKTGRDGIHGATFSSESADGTTATLHAGAVQIGNAIEEKMVFDAIQEATERGLIRAMTDCGAAGFASAVGEMGSEIGVEIDLANAPLKYQGLSAWEIYISESQERMVLSVDPEHYAELADIFAKHGSNCDVLGTFGSQDERGHRLHVMHNGETVIDLDYDFIENGVPLPPLHANWIEPVVEEIMPDSINLTDVLCEVLSNGNVASAQPIVRQYDHEVQGTSALKPFDGKHGNGRNDAVVMTPILGKPYAVVQAHGTNPTLTELDPVSGTKWVFAEAVANYVAAGGNPDDMVMVNNYISATPTERVVGAIDLSVDTLADCVDEFHAPIISGKDSLSSTFIDKKNNEVIESPYNLTLTVAGKLPDVAKTVSSDIKRPGSTLVVVGALDREAMGGSIYYQECGGSSAIVPDIDLTTFHSVTRAVHQAMQSGQVHAAKSVKEGGVITAVSEMLFGGDCGADIDETELATLFNETAGCFVLEVPDSATAEALFADVPYQLIGKTKQDKELSVTGHEPIPTETLFAAWQQPLEEVFA